MGNLVSSNAALSPISVASIIVGFVSFIFTLATALRVFWANLRTIGSANREVHDVLPNLKQALYEERAHLRLTRRRHKAQYEEAAFRVLAESIRHMISEFKRLEEPFIEDPLPVRSGGARQVNGRANGKRGKDHGLESGQADVSDDYYLLNYHATTFGQRFLWLKRKGNFMSLSDSLSRVQTRRIARQQTDSSIDTRYLASAIGDIQDRLESIEQRLSRVVGVRRVD